MNLENYERLAKQATALIESETDFIANLSNISALLFMELDDLNWAGFYLMKQGELVLGPFQGKPACVRIPVGRGVCALRQKPTPYNVYTMYTRLKVTLHVMLQAIQRL